SHPLLRVHRCRLVAGAWVCRRAGDTAAILYRVDAFDSERSNRTGPCWNFDDYGHSCGPVVSHYGECWDGSRLYACYRYSVAIDELWRFFSVVHISGAGDCYEHSNAPFRELIASTQAQRQDLVRFGQKDYVSPQRNEGA